MKSGAAMKTIPFRLLVCFAGCLFLSCWGNAGDHTGANSDNSSLEYQKSAQQAEPNQLPAWNRPRSKERQQERNQMVSEIRRYYSLNAPKILEAMQNVPRHWFVPAEQQVNAYVDSPLPIGHDQTISQPFIVAYMTSVLAPDPNSRVLEIGTGSGYQAAVLNEFTPHVFSIEIVKPLGERAIEVFKKYEYNTIRVKIGDGYKGWPEYAPFDAIIVTCAPDKIPGPLLDQLKPGGKMIIPVGKQRDGQQLILVTKDPKGKISKRSMMPVRFVPLTREKE
ncbi:MAG TPA: protein-L-isoaspartate(D-aspartate) O-methyltransferase [Anaerohalosphaeraceae bacterium]|nr:protein-L-isoaspartate(D-aspartate) O-methyltransferase [Anaerohalosphaeraceae bacterium]